MQDHDRHLRQMKLGILRTAGYFYGNHVHSFTTHSISKTMSWFGGDESPVGALYGNLELYFFQLEREEKIIKVNEVAYHEDDEPKQLWALTETGREIALQRPPLMNPILASLGVE